MNRSLQHPTTTEVVVFVVRKRRSEVLVLKRIPRLGGFWHPVAGTAEDGESSDAAAVRELAEEIRLTVASLATAPHARFTYDLDGAAVGVACILLDTDDRYEPSLNWEHDEYRWCSVAEAVELLRWPTVSAALQAMLSTRATHLQADRAVHDDARVVKARLAISPAVESRHAG